MLRTLGSLSLASRNVANTCTSYWNTTLTVAIMYVSVAAKKMSLRVSHEYQVLLCSSARKIQ
jgi:hypothetical protein